MSILVGAAFLIGADLVARTVDRPAEIPVGIITAFCGVPFFLYLLRRARTGSVLVIERARAAEAPRCSPSKA